MVVYVGESQRQENMNVIVQAKDLKVTRALREFIERQAGKLKKLQGLKVSKVEVYLEKGAAKGTDKRVSIKYKVEIPGKNIWVEISGYDFYDAAVDATRAVLRKLRKNKEKRLDHQRSHGSGVSFA